MKKDTPVQWDLAPAATPLASIALPPGRPASPATVAAGARERADSPWLGDGAQPSPTFLRYRQFEHRLAAWGLVPTPAVSPGTAAGAFMDWWVHLLASPAKQWELVHEGLLLWLRAAGRASLGDSPTVELPQDKRFDDPAWRLPPFSLLEQAFLVQQSWWHLATTGVPGTSRHHEQMVSFAARQWLDTLAPTNFLATNPVVIRRTLQEAGTNLARGAAHAWEDAWREATDQAPAGAEAFRVGVEVAATPGKVVLRNRLMELIQYAPSTRTVHPEPVLIVPAWIMKYYVLDLSPHNSLVKHLVDQGFTVFAISWKNPQASDRDLGLNDYHRLGVCAALDAIGRIVPGAGVHATGYCLGGTLLSMSAAALGRRQANPLRSLTLLATQTDFTEPGELALFTDEGQVAFLDNLMSRQGYLDKRQMSRTFQMMRSRDLVWSRRVHDNLLGERSPMSDLMAWNADGTRLPRRMHLDYLRGLFLQNALARGEWHVDGEPVNLDDIHVPVFNVGTVQDHVAPWRSVFRLHTLTDAEQTFVLTAGGHNVGIVNPPGQAKSSYRLRTWQPADRLLTPDEWLASTEPIAGSWWTAWVGWLENHSSRRRRAPPAMGCPQRGLPPLDDAPGEYVHQR
jgi:polyhydroxyalkanoate synthase